MSSSDPWCSKQASSSDQSSTVILKLPTYVSYSFRFIILKAGPCIIELFAHCKGGNFIHSYLGVVWLSSSAKQGKSGSIYKN